jgi:hypothetical protein
MAFLGDDSSAGLQILPMMLSPRFIKGIKIFVYQPGIINRETFFRNCILSLQDSLRPPRSLDPAFTHWLAFWFLFFPCNYGTCPSSKPDRQEKHCDRCNEHFFVHFFFPSDSCHTYPGGNLRRADGLQIPQSRVARVGSQPP